MTRIVVFGATGYTGRLTAEALVARGERPVLAARSADRVRALGADLGGLDTAVADVARPETVRALVERGDVMVSTVGPFVRYGHPAVQAAVDAGAVYFDSTGEPVFIRAVFERYGPAAAGTGAALMTAMGYDWVPGNLAGALAAERAGPAAARVDTGYFLTGDAGMSGGTRATTAAGLTAPGFAWRGGRIVTERGAKRVRSFAVDGERRQAVGAGASDHFGIPRFAPGVREVNAYLGWFGAMSRPLQVFSAAGSVATAIPGVAALAEAATKRFVKGSTGGPDEQQRAGSGSHVVAIAYDAGGTELSQVHLGGVNPYTFTAAMLAWAAIRGRSGAVAGTGALAPVEAFGLRDLEAGAAEAGIAEA